MLANKFVNPSKFMSKEEMMLIEEERLRQNLVHGDQLLAMKKSKERELNELQSKGGMMSERDRREI